jgi:diguanylate cyclase (GGDEF)-like protein/PAS domain S-box-containing protein
MGNLISEVIRHNAERDVYEDNLRNSESKVRQITTVMGDGLYVLDQDGKVTFLNAEAERLLGWSEAELIGKNGHEIFHYKTPDGKPITVENCPVHRTIITGGTYRSPNDWLVCRDGRILPVSIVSSPIIENGKVTGSVAAFHDITQRLEAEKTLREREARFRLLFNSGNDAILVHLLNVEDGRGRFVEVNNVACRRLGYSRGELLEMSPLDIDDPESASNMDEIAQQIRSNGFALFERTHVTKGGEKIPVEVNSHVFEMGGTPMLMSVVRDISERKQSELEYKTILQTTRDGFLVVDTRDNSFIDANDAYCTMLGYTREEMLKLHTTDVEAQETSEETKAHVRALVAQGYGRFETRHRCKNGQLLEVEISLHYLAIKGGLFITFIRDISERIRAEAIQDEMKRDQKALLDATRESAILMERSGIILAINQIGAKRLRGTVDELIGKNIYDLIPPELAKVRREHNDKSFQNGVPTIREDEREGMCMLTSIYPVVDANGEINRVALYSADITEQKQTQERIQHMAQYDSLTDMPNRALFYDRLRQAVTLAKRSKVGLALLFLDLDRFKQVNDTLGHHVGDLLLKNVAERLRLCVRESDTAARLGGDEFTVLLYDLREREDIGRVAEKIIESISMPYELEGHDVQIGVSIGIARFSDDTDDEDKLMKLADKAMYTAKSAGRNTYRFCVESE